MMIKTIGPWLKSDRPGFKSWLCRLLAAWPWTDYLAFLSGSSLMHEMRIMIPFLQELLGAEEIMHIKSLSPCWAQGLGQW